MPSSARIVDPTATDPSGEPDSVSLLLLDRTGHIVAADGGWPALAMANEWPSRVGARFGDPDCLNSVRRGLAVDCQSLRSPSAPGVVSIWSTGRPPDHRRTTVRAALLPELELIAASFETHRYQEAARGSGRGHLTTEPVPTAAIDAGQTVGFMVADLDGRIVLTNHAWLNHPGHGRHPAAGENIAGLLRNPDDICDVLSDLFNQRSFARRLAFAGAAGTRHVLGAMLPETSRFVLVWQSEDAPVDAAPQHGSPRAAAGRVASIVSHDLNNVLGAVAGYCHLLRPEVRDRPSAVQDFGALERAGQEAALIVRQLASIGGQRVAEPGHIALGPFLDSGATQWRFWLPDSRLQVAGPPTPVAARVDPDVLNDVMLSLVIYARDSLPGGGTVQLEAGTTPGGAWAYLQMRLTPRGECLPPPVVSTSWDALSQGRSPLSLFAVQEWLTLSGGRIEVTPADDGLVILVSLPPGTQNVRGSHVASADASVALEACRGYTVLLVEDLASLRDLATRALTAHGLHVYPACSGAEALALLQTIPARVDALITDIMLPGMDGWTVASCVLGQYPDCRVVYVSGDSQQAGRAAAMREEGAFLAKPFTPLELIRTLLTLFSASGNRSSV